MIQIYGYGDGKHFKVEQGKIFHLTGIIPLLWKP